MSPSSINRSYFSFSEESTAFPPGDAAELTDELIEFIMANDTGSSRNVMHNVDKGGGTVVDNPSCSGVSGYSDESCSNPHKWQRQQSQPTDEDETDDSVDADTDNLPVFLDGDSSDDESYIPATIDAPDTGPPAKKLKAKANVPYWSYGKQAKGPKPEKFSVKIDLGTDGHSPIQFNDPVFDSDNGASVSHVGKMRKGNGNDITPDVSYLRRLGKTIEEDVINQQEETNEQQKQIIHSRICRNKKRANHEANKIILEGLEQERAELSAAIKHLGKLMKKYHRKTDVHIYKEYEKYLTENRKTLVAGQTETYVNTLLNDETLT